MNTPTPLNVDDVKELTFQLFLAQREIDRLRAVNAELLLRDEFGPHLVQAPAQPGAASEPASDEGSAT